MTTGFSPKEITLVDRALEISEDAACNYYHISASNWKKYGFEVSNLAQLQESEITDAGLAQITRYVSSPGHFRPGGYPRDYYRVCLQDHNIITFLQREKQVDLFPLLIYILTHELVHVIRFRKFQQRFDVSREEKEVEETRVHRATFEILKPIKKIELAPILDSYIGHRCPETIGMM